MVEPTLGPGEVILIIVATLFVITVIIALVIGATIVVVKIIDDLEPGPYDGRTVGEVMDRTESFMDGQESIHQFQAQVDQDVQAGQQAASIGIADFFEDVFQTINTKET